MHAAKALTAGPRALAMSGWMAWILLSAAPVSVFGAPNVQRIAINTEDGVTIVGDFVAPAPAANAQPAPIVILLHMYGQTRATWAPLAPELHQRGYALVAIDLRGHGESVVGPPTQNLRERILKQDRRVFRAMHRDVTAAYLWAAKVAADTGALDLTRVALVGASVGGSVAIDYAARDRSVDTVVCLSPGVDYLGIDTLSHIRKFGERPVLMLTSTQEKAAPEVLAKLTPNAELTVIGGAGHGTRMFNTVRDLPQRIADYLDAHIGGPATQPVVASVNSEIFHEPTSGTAKRISATNLRWFSSPDEAQQRGLRPGRKRQAAKRP